MAIRRRVVAPSGTRRTVPGKAANETVMLDDRPLSIRTSRDGKHIVVAVPYELWIISASALEVERTFPLPVSEPTVFESEDDGTLWIGGAHLHRASWVGTSAPKVGSKLGGLVDRVCIVRPRLLCGVGSQGEVLWDAEKEEIVHRRKSSDHEVLGLVASPDGRAVWADGSNHAWAIDPDHPSGYTKIKLKATSPTEVDEEGIPVIGLTTNGRVVLAARDGGVGWTNRALRLVAERFPKAERSVRLPLDVAGDEQWIYVLRPLGVLHRFLVEPPAEGDLPPGESPPAPAETAKLKRPASCLTLDREGHLVLAGPHADGQLGRVWRERIDELGWEPLSLRPRTLVEPPPPAPEPEPTGPKRPDFTPTRSKLGGSAIAQLKVDDVLSGSPAFWVTRDHGSILERPTGVLAPDEVLPNDVLLLPAMFRLHAGTARPGIVIWPGRANENRPLPAPGLLTWGDEPRGWMALETPQIRAQGWSRREVFPLQVALAHAPPEVAGRREELPGKWTDPELFSALVRECKKLLKVLW